MKQSTTLTQTAALRAGRFNTSAPVPNLAAPPLAPSEPPVQPQRCVFVDVESSDAAQKICSALSAALATSAVPADRVPSAASCVFLCIGTERVISDSLGPRVGTLLQLRMSRPVYVYGFCGSNVNALNLLAAHAVVRLLHPDKTLVVIDAAVGDEPELGTVQVFDGPLEPGAATNKNLPNLGDISILAIVSRRGLADFYTTGQERAALVDKTATAIADAILMLK